jgi:hypothetical protein
MVIIRHSYHCTTAAALAFVEGPELLGGVIYIWQELVMDYIIVALKTKRLM